MDKLVRAGGIIGGGSILAGVLQEFFLYDVDGGQRAVIFDKFRGIQSDVKPEGTHFKIPFIQDPKIFDIRSKPRMIGTDTGTKDLQIVNIRLRILARPVESKLSTIYQRLGIDYDERILPTIGNEVLKAIVAQYNAEELLSKREHVSNLIRAQLTERSKKYDIILDDVSIVHLAFGKEFSRAIENKQVAQQEAETQHYIVLKSEQEKKASIIRAEGEAEAAILISKSIASAGSGLIDVRRIDTAKDVVNILSKSKNITYLPSNKDSNMLLGVNTNQ